MIWATGDCHGNFERFRPEYFPEQAQMTKDDVVVVTGDFGGIWFGDARDDEALGCRKVCPSRWRSWTATMKTMMRWQAILQRNGRAVKYTASVRMCCI